LISVIVPTFNRLDYLRPALDSVFAQTFDAWELVVADDGSDVATRTHLASLTAPRGQRIERLWLPHRGSPAAVRNAALGAARGEHVAFLDSDDLWAPRKLEEQLAALRARPDCHWCYTAFTRVDSSGVALSEERDRLWIPHQGAVFDDIARGAAAIRTPSVMATRRLVLDAGAFDEALPSAEDYDLWMRLALRSPVALVDEALVFVRLHDDNLTRDWSSAFIGRDRSLRKLQSQVDPRRRALLQRERARNAAQLAAEHAARGDRKAAWQALWQARSYAWPHAAWWKQLARRALGR